VRYITNVWIPTVVFGVLFSGLMLPSPSSPNSFCEFPQINATKIQYGLLADSNCDPVYVEPPLAPVASSQTSPAAAADLSDQDLANVFKLHSDPTSRNIIYLDFDGYDWESGTEWRDAFGVDLNGRFSPGFNMDSNPLSFSKIERQNIHLIWQSVAEDFAVFDVDVTTEKPSGARALDFAERGAVALIMSDTELQQACQCGGAVWSLDSFQNGNPYLRPSWSFMNFDGNFPAAWDIGIIVAHEVGHSLGLNHDGTSSEEYYGGPKMWTPIMGVGRGAGITTWNAGDYPDAVTKQPQPLQDDFLSLARHIPLREDTVGGTFETAELINFQGNAQFEGLIEDRNDLDLYAFEVVGKSSQPTLIEADPWGYSPNLDIELKLFNASGQLVSTSNPLVDVRFHFDVVAAGLNAKMKVNLKPGKYFLQIDGVGQGSPLLETGYSDYASVGRYSVQIRNTKALVPVISKLAKVQFRAGDLVEVRGQKLDTVSRVRVGTAPAEIIAKSSKKLTFRMPIVAGGQLELSNKFGIAAASQKLKVSAARPSISSVSTSAARVGDKITIFGSNFAFDSKVFIGRLIVKDMKVISPTRITLTVPAKAKNGIVSVRGFAGSATSKVSIQVIR
jgi:hypothetical protein